MNRRNFVQTFSAAVAAVTVAPAGALSARIAPPPVPWIEDGRGLTSMADCSDYVLFGYDIRYDYWDWRYVRRVGSGAWWVATAEESPPESEDERRRFEMTAREEMRRAGVPDLPRTHPIVWRPHKSVVIRHA